MPINKKRSAFVLIGDRHNFMSIHRQASETSRFFFIGTEEWEQTAV